ncbi:MAG: hypothetical protein H5U20_06030, partial [Rhodobacteraceae bacterium]|nr:hypothetical protein [Paracoccaceae bacterium]
MAAPPFPAPPRPVPGSRAVVHIGLHKTATTLIQATLAANRAALAAHGVDYPRAGPGPAHHALLALWHEMPPGSRPDGDPRALWAGLAALAAPGRTLLLSSEVFARAAPPRADLGQMRALLAAYAEIRLVCVLRAPIAHIQSLVLEVARQAPLDLARAIRMALAEGRAEGVAVDRMRLHARLRADFAAHEIVYLDHAGFQRTATGPAAAVLAAAGAPAAAGEGLAPPP